MTEQSNQESGSEPVESETLIFVPSPVGNVDAIVEHDGRTVYFYLNGQQPFGTRACWVCNLQPGPFVINQEDMQSGRPPMLPRTHTMRTDGRSLPVAESLKIVWFEECNGAALLENGNPIAIIPPWSGADGFHGYSAECAAESQICWPIPQNPQLTERINRSEEFWKSFSSTESQPFAQLQTELLNCYRERFGTAPDGTEYQSRYFAIDGGQFPPRGMIAFKRSDSIVALSVGMSLLPQPNVEMAVQKPAGLRRVEVGLQLQTGKEIDDCSTVMSYLSGIAGLPWKSFSWLGNGHTIDSQIFTDALGPQFHFAGLISDSIESSMPSFRDDPINLLWLAPLNESERDQLVAKKTGFAKLGMQDRISVQF